MGKSKKRLVNEDVRSWKIEVYFDFDDLPKLLDEMKAKSLGNIVEEDITCREVAYKLSLYSTVISKE